MSGAGVLHVEPRIIPALLVRDGQLVKTRRFADPVYVGDPVNVLSIFSDFEVDEIVLLDIGAARDRTPTPLAELRRYAEECFIPLAYGGGLTTLEQLGDLFAAGFEKAVLNTVLAEDPAVVTEAARRHGSQALVGSIDVRGAGRDARVVVRGATREVSDDVVGWARRAVELGVGELLVTSVDREGTFEGLDLDLVAAVTAAVDVPVIAHGGAGRRKDLAAPVLEHGASAVAAGSLFVFQGKDRGVLVNYPPRAQVTRLLGIA